MSNLYKSNFNYSNNNRGNNTNKAKKLTIKQMGKNAKSSCIDVGHFLCDLQRASKYIRLYKLLK